MSRGRRFDLSAGVVFVGPRKMWWGPWRRLTALVFEVL